jgi:hypothetical protein
LYYPVDAGDLVSRLLNEVMSEAEKLVKAV